MFADAERAVLHICGCRTSGSALLCPDLLCSYRYPCSVCEQTASANIATLAASAYRPPVLITLRDIVIIILVIVSIIVVTVIVVFIIIVIIVIVIVLIMIM